MTSSVCFSYFATAVKYLLHFRRGEPFRLGRMEDTSVSPFWSIGDSSMDQQIRLNNDLTQCSIEWREEDELAALNRERRNGSSRSGSVDQTKSFGDLVSDSLSTSVSQYSSTSVSHYSSTPASQYSSTPASQYSSTPASQYSSTPASQYSSTPASQYSSTPASQYSSTSASNSFSQSSQTYSSKPTSSIHSYNYIPWDSSLTPLPERKENQASLGSKTTGPSRPLTKEPSKPLFPTKPNSVSSSSLKPSSKVNVNYDTGLGPFLTSLKLSKKKFIGSSDYQSLVCCLI